MICPDGTNVPEWAVQNQQLLFTGLGTLTTTTPQFMCWHPQKQADPEPMWPLWMRITIAEQPWGTVASAAVLGGGSGPAGGYEYGETEDYFIYPRKEAEPLKYDWGDAPDGAAAPVYPTLSINNGANHVIAGPWLGDDYDQPDSESDGQPQANALGDNNNGNDDENGVTIPTLIRGETADITLDVRGGGGIVQAWIDFNGNFTWQATEKIFNAFLPNGAHTISFSVPTSAMLGPTFARFRISKQGGLGPEGPALDGEVEDHEVFVEDAPRDIKWVQWPDLTRNGIDICVGRSDGNYRRIADDFECTNNNRITTISIWGSWKNDNKGVIKNINLSIYSDDPMGPGGQEPDNQFSKPGFWRWQRSFSPDKFQETLYHVVRDPGEWWWEPVREEYGPGGDSEVWRIDIYINPDEAFLQEGLPDNPVIYWLVVQVDTEDGDFGWKTRQWPDHYMDDAVFWSCKLQSCDWSELRYPKTHPYHNLEKNSIDMAFQLTYTDEGPEQPTSRPVSATQCPVAQTQCPAVVTRCPPVQTQCPAVQTQCPAVQTQCPAAQTLCPAVPTNCPAVKTKCPAVQTQCPAVNTECPPVATECTEIAETKCPPLETRCPVVETECPPLETKCNIEPTKCPPVDTKCPAVDTECPPVPTKCTGIIETKCPSRVTGCPVVETECPPVDTECPARDTECPPIDTECPPVNTKCPVDRTKCPPIDTSCPEDATTCPVHPTKCPAEPTQCEIIPTQCPVATECPSPWTRCPPRVTHCPPDDTRCPPDDTRCPPVNTRCPTQVSRCPPLDTQCGAKTLCPPVDTECPEEPTTCPPYPTKCVIVPTQCQVLTECPATPTKCKSEDTVCPRVSTECPPENTKCPPCGFVTILPVKTRCPIFGTKCPVVDTECPVVDTECPIVWTECPPPPPGMACLIETQFGPNCLIETQFGPNCLITGLPCFLGEGTKSVPYVRKCPAIDVQVPTVITKPIAKAF